MTEAISEISKSSAERSAVYAGSFDPPTNGHLWIIQNGSVLFDKLHVAVAVNPEKKSMFTLDERVEMLAEISEPYHNVSIGHFVNRYTVNYAKDLGCRYLLRGLRDFQDLASEQKLSSINRDIAPDIETIYMTGPDELLKISSSSVKGMMGPEGWEQEVSRYIPQVVLSSLENWFQQRKSEA